ncbi:helix-hairpin-helix domain-containing protein [Arthrobacter sp. zg-Y179]|uniref:helix-hairpin-helix domain-containing protein n=1 Tax=Arthrobacter sp. zg-Y179 TaxID=2894188 RepID=UPI001E2A957F|nr:helix-hairpin-helix domain-containing protein [Arthrobacter sp. zg-Y179]MCC9174569.1 helix-hairpin-helix domain-containing protein [Arthrobacter sp. zg-Y179]
MAQHRWDTADIHGSDGLDPLNGDTPGVRRRWAFSLPAAVLAVCVLLGCGAAILLFRDRGPVPVASIELSAPPADPSLAAEDSGSPRGTSPPASASATPPSSTLPSDSGEPGGGTATMVVHVAGAVQRPGVVRLAPGSRIVDAVDAAGGTGADADLAGVNLAALVEDGAMVLVPRIGEGAPSQAGAGGNAAEGSAPAGSGSVPPAEGSASGSINLNTADSTQLQTLPRIGPVLAERIITWRTEHGKFSRPEDLDAVPGIGEAMMAALLPLVSV